MSDPETAHAYRGIVARSVVRSTNDAGGSQTASVTTHRHVDRTDVEIIQTFGFASRSPDGGSMIVLAVGGDQGDLAGLPIAAPGARLGNLKKGESAQHNAKGDRVHIKDDGSIEATSTKRVKSKVKTVTCEVTEDRIVGAIGTGIAAPRVVVRPDFVKLRLGNHWLVVKADGIYCSVAPVVGADPEPAV
ncbi:phage baseplate assembly protein [Bosea sp. 685]|uniref:phage baseplate assembly protein n=1 Tax=Bosea sp. 685 TaxID=3080057 RepID=UPI002893204F|nr:phage baseplate assembly protein [Bosea sp. 685]WNJ89175.1 phage baseplate assembly protein [Bosea sp. 685]